jgi:hypothetical protein
VADLDQAATRALQAAQEMLRAADEAQAGLALVRERVAETAARLDGEWARLLEVGRELLEQATAEERDLPAARAESVAALDQLGRTAQQLVQEAAHEAEETRVALEASLGRVETLPAEALRLADESEAAEQAVRDRLEAIETELGQALAETEQLLQEAWTAELRDLGAEVERATSALAACVEAECLPTVTAHSRALFDRLVATEDELRSTLERTATATETATEEALRACAGGFDEALAELRRAGSDTGDHLDHLRASLDGQVDDFGSTKDRWDELLRATLTGLREARDALRQLEDMLHQFSFVHF